MHRAHTLLVFFTLFLGGSLSPLASSHADILSAVSDPLGAEEAMAPYASNNRLKPASCPTIPIKGHAFTAGEIVVLSLCHNPDLFAAYLTLASSADSTVSEYSAYFPTLSASASLSRLHSISEGSKSISKSSGLSSSWTLYDFGQRELSIEAS